MKATRLRVEYLVEPMGLDDPEPRFSWVVESDRRGDQQSAYELAVSAAGPGGEERLVWSTGRVPSTATIHVPYEGDPLSSDTTYLWSVRVWDADGLASEQACSKWHTGLFDRDEWQAEAISAPEALRVPAEPPEGIDFGGRSHAPPTVLRKRFRLESGATSARAFVTALGVYELYVNGERVGADLLTPGWTDFSKRLQYQCYEVGPLLREGENVVAALVGDGWYSGRIAWQQRLYGEHPALIAQLHIDGPDGRVVVVTDEEWEALPSHLLWSDILTGESQDLSAVERVTAAIARGEGTGVSVDTGPLPAAALVGQRSPTVRRLFEIPAVNSTPAADGRLIIDFGQNVVGWVQLEVEGAGDATVTVRHAEMLDPEGGIYTDNYRAAQSVDLYALPGDAAGRVILEPRFTWRGFRYAEIAGLNAEALRSAKAVVIGSDTPTAGSFECSSPMVSQLQRNIEWGQRGNFLEVPTDCPQRDERLGWMGDAQVFIPTACWNADVASFFVKWLDDVLDARAVNGAFADVAPVVRAELFAEASPGWGDAGVIVPWVLYERYGDVRVLERCFDAMVAWVAYIREANPDLLWMERRNNDYGDWLSIGEHTPHDVLATAYFARSADLVGRAARVLGRKEEAEEHEQLFSDIKKAFNDAYVAPSGRIVGHTQTAYVLALAFGLLPPDKIEAAAQHLAERITQPRGFRTEFTPGHLATGFLGVGELLPTLTGVGLDDIAFQLLENDTFPSWGYSIAQGATTIWERWDGWTHERGFQDSSMNSFNHYSLGAVGHWLFSVLGGIEADLAHPAFEQFRVRPRIGGSINWARADHESIRGRISSEWRVDGERVELRVTVPANAVAEVWVPRASVTTLTEGGAPVSEAEGVRIVGDRDGAAVVTVGGGTYTFTSA